MNSLDEKKQPQLRAITMRVVIPAINDDTAFEKLESALLACCESPQIQFLASAPASQELAYAYASGDMAALNNLLENSPVTIPFGLDYSMVDHQHGGVAAIVSGENSAWIGIENPNKNDEVPDGSMAAYIRRTDDGMSVDLNASGAEFEPLSSAFAEYSEAQAVQDEHGNRDAAQSGDSMKMK